MTGHRCFYANDALFFLFFKRTFASPSNQKLIKNKGVKRSEWGGEGVSHFYNNSSGSRLYCSRNNTLRSFFLVPYPFKIEASLQNSLSLQCTCLCILGILSVWTFFNAAHVHLHRSTDDRPLKNGRTFRSRSGSLSTLSWAFQFQTKVKAHLIVNLKKKKNPLKKSTEERVEVEELKLKRGCGEGVTDKRVSSQVGRGQKPPDLQHESQLNRSGGFLFRTACSDHGLFQPHRLARGARLSKNTQHQNTLAMEKVVIASAGLLSFRDFFDTWTATWKHLLCG